MKVLFDHQIFSVQEYGGVSRLFSELYSGLKYFNVESDLSLLVSNNENIKHLGKKPFFKGYDFWGKLTLMERYNRIFSIKKLLLDTFDIFHPTYFKPYFLPYLNSRPFVLTVHDMIHEKFYMKMRNSQQIIRWKKLLIEKSHAIIAVSQNTKNDLIKIYNIDPKKIHVIYHGNSLKNPNSKNKRIHLPDTYILFVGGRKDYKNFGLFVRAIAKIIKKNDVIKLVCVGGGRFDDNEINLLNSLDMRENVIQLTLDDEELAYCYHKALCFVFPSLYEGFGIPLVEAFHSGCPVIASKIESFKEVADDAVIYFDPYSVDSIEQSISRVMYDDTLRNKLIRLGKLRAKDFSWKKTIAQTIDVYKSIL